MKRMREKNKYLKKERKREERNDDFTLCVGTS